MTAPITIVGVIFEDGESLCPPCTKVWLDDAYGIISHAVPLPIMSTDTTHFNCDDCGEPLDNVGSESDQ